GELHQWARSDAGSVHAVGATASERPMTDPAANRALIERFWATLYERDFDGVGAFFADDGEYTDMPTPPEDVARGPEQIAARLRLRLATLEAISPTADTLAVQA